MSVDLCMECTTADNRTQWQYIGIRSRDRLTIGETKMHHSRLCAVPPDEPIVQIQRVDHESRVHIDIETDDISAEVARLEKPGARVADRLERWVVMQAPTGQRFCVVRVQRPRFPKNANRWD